MNKINNKSLISVAVLVLALAIGYYFIFSLPKLNEKKFMLSMQEKCRDAGEKAYKADLKQYNTNSLNQPQYGYNKKLNTCIYASGRHNTGSPLSGKSKGDFLTHNCDASWELWVKDSYTNKEIASIFNFNDAQCNWVTSVEAIDNFYKQSKELFENTN